MTDLTGNSQKQIDYATSERADQLARYERVSAAYEAALTDADWPLSASQGRKAEQYWFPARAIWLERITSETDAGRLLDYIRQQGLPGDWNEHHGPQTLADSRSRLTSLAAEINRAETQSIIAAKRGS
jgi:hypothetical protein